MHGGDREPAAVAATGTMMSLHQTPNVQRGSSLLRAQAKRSLGSEVGPGKSRILAAALRPRGTLVIAIQVMGVYGTHTEKSI